MRVMEEKEIIRYIQSGNTESYRLLVDRYQAGLIIHCDNILKNREEGEDVAQDAFIQAFKKLSSFDGERTKFSTWLYKIATNLCIDILRRNRKKIQLEDVESHLEFVQPTFMEDEEKIALQKLINELEPPKYGAIIRAYFWEGKSYRELADEYGTTTNTIGTWMSRAKDQLKENLS